MRSRHLLAVLALTVITSLDGQAHAQNAPARGAASAADPWSDLVAEAASRFGLPAPWLQAVMRVESNGDAVAVSSKGALGLMQLMPQTYAAMRIQLGLGADPLAPRDNIMAGAAYLRALLDRYGSPGFLAAYNAGPQRFEDYLARRRPLPPETIAYLARLGQPGGLSRAATSAARHPRPIADSAASPVFVTRAASDTAQSVGIVARQSWRNADLFAAEPAHNQP